MKEFLKRVPLPLCAVGLGLAALGNLVQSFSNEVRMVLGFIALIFSTIVILKALLIPKNFKEEVKNPIMASVFLTLPMALMLLSVYLKPFIGVASKIIWYCSILFHIIMMIIFTLKFIVNFDLKKVFASYYIVYVGIVVASITAPAFESLLIGKIAFYFGFISLLILLYVVNKRYIKFPEVPIPAKPIICITAAPVSLCLAGYISSFETKSLLFIIGMLVFSTILYIYSFIKLIQTIRGPFFPSFAAYTFPFVITAIALKQSVASMTKLGLNVKFLGSLVLIETIIALVLVTFVTYKFIVNMIKK